MTWEIKYDVPTYFGSVPTREANRSPSEFDLPHVPVLISPADGVRLILGSQSYAGKHPPDIQIERRPQGWAIFLMLDATEHVATIYVLDDGRSFLMPERFVGQRMEIVDNIPPQLDSPDTRPIEM